MLARGGPALGLGNFIAESLIAKLVDKIVSFYSLTRSAVFVGFKILSRRSVFVLKAWEGKMQKKTGFVIFSGLQKEL